MSIMEKAKKELSLLDWTDDKEVYDGMLSKAVIELLECFCKQRHSGASAWSTLHVFNRLAKLKPLTPLTGKDDEWREIPGFKQGTTEYQNKRWSSLFKDKKDGKAYYHKQTENDTVKEFVEFPFEVP